MGKKNSICIRCLEDLADEEDEVCRRCCRDPFPEDTELRCAGFSIWRRPAPGMAVWKRDGRYYHHAQALLIARDKVSP